MADNNSSGTNTILIVLLIIIVLVVGFFIWRGYGPKAPAEDTKDVNVDIKLPSPSGNSSEPAP